MGKEGVCREEAPDSGQGNKQLHHHMNEQTKTPASYGEPWLVTDGESLAVINAHGDYIQLQEDDFKIADGRLVIRAVQCVNACQGIADPAEAIKEAREALEDAAEIAEGMCARYESKKFRNALAKLNNTAP